MAQDLRRNVWQKTPGEIRRAYVAAPLTQQSQKSRSGDIVPCMNRWSPLAVGRHASWMGNTVSGTSHRLAGAAELLQDPSLQYEGSLGSSRFLRATRVRHEHGLLVVKTFLKPDAGMRLRGLLRRLQLERDALENVPNVLAMQEVIETEVAGYLIRPWLAYSLYDRVSTRPFLTDMEKLWITYQLVYALHATHERKVAHGDLKCENVLVTSSLCVYVTDFASLFKPTYLPLDDPTDFSLFFDSSARRVCHIAPERFYESVTEVPSSRTSPELNWRTPAMDRSRVDLPTPLTPTMAVSFPGSAVKLTSSTTMRSLMRHWTLRTSRRVMTHSRIGTGCAP